MKPIRNKPLPGAESGKVRIIGGRWRGTRLEVPHSPGLRPSGDRVRETLFNWLQPTLANSRVLDLFAGTGALGLEAVSRGAAHAVLVEQDPLLVAALRQAVSRLSASEQVEVVQGEALDWLRGQAEQSFDLAFLDPPFAGQHWQPALELLMPRLRPGAWLYVESPVALAPRPPLECALHREGSTREVRYALYRVPGLRGADTLGADASVAVTE